MSGGEAGCRKKATYHLALQVAASPGSLLEMQSLLTLGSRGELACIFTLPWPPWTSQWAPLGPVPLLLPPVGRALAGPPDQETCS